MRNSNCQDLSKNWKTCPQPSRSVGSLRKGMSDWEVVLLWVFVYAGRGIEDVRFESWMPCMLVNNCVLFWTPACSGIKFCLVMPCHVFCFYFHFIFFDFPFDTVPAGLSHFRAPSLKWLLRTKIAHSGLQAPSEHGAPVQRDRSRILGSWGSWHRGTGTLRAVCHSVWNLTHVYRWKNCWAYVHKGR